MNVAAAKEAARVYHGHEPGEHWDKVWRGTSREYRSIWYDVAKAVEPLCEPQNTPVRNNSTNVDQEADLASAILRLQKRVDDLEAAMGEQQTLTRPIGSAKVAAKTVADAGAAVANFAHKKGYL